MYPPSPPCLSPGQPFRSQKERNSYLYYIGVMMNSPGTDSVTQGVGWRRAGRPRDTRIDETVPRVVIEILNEVGYRGLTLEEVAARAGTSKPALRRRWRTRQQLILGSLGQAIGTSPTPDT